MIGTRWQSIRYKVPKTTRENSEYVEQPLLYSWNATTTENIIHWAFVCLGFHQFLSHCLTKSIRIDPMKRHKFRTGFNYKKSVNMTSITTDWGYFFDRFSMKIKGANSSETNSIDDLSWKFICTKHKLFKGMNISILYLKLGDHWSAFIAWDHKLLRPNRNYPFTWLNSQVSATLMFHAARLFHGINQQIIQSTYLWC